LKNSIVYQDFSPIISNCSDGLKNAVKQMLEKDQHDRIAIEQIQKLPFLPKTNTQMTLAQNLLIGIKYQEGNGFSQNKVKAMKYLKLVADSGDMQGMIYYGIGLEKWFLGSKDLKGAMKCFKTIADLGNTQGMVCYGVGLEKGYLGTKF
jgi:TPR repeat protein